MAPLPSACGASCTCEGLGATRAFLPSEAVLLRRHIVLRGSETSPKTRQESDAFDVNIVVWGERLSVLCGVKNLRCLFDLCHKSILSPGQGWHRRADAPRLI